MGRDKVEVNFEGTRSLNLKPGFLVGPTIRPADYLNAAKVFHWASKEHYKLWFTGKEFGRHRLTETVLPKLVREGRLAAVRYGLGYVYTEPRRVRKPGHYLKINHGLAATEGLVRFWRSDLPSTILPERYFYGGGVVPEFGLITSRQRLLLFEYCSADNFERTGRLISKFNAYDHELDLMADKFGALGVVVIFVVAVSQERLEGYLTRLNNPVPSFYFVDYKTFVKVPIGQQFTAQIYTWKPDMQKYSLRQQ